MDSRQSNDSKDSFCKKGMRRAGQKELETQKDYSGLPEVRHQYCLKTIALCTAEQRRMRHPETKSGQYESFSLQLYKKSVKTL